MPSGGMRWNSKLPKEGAGPRGNAGSGRNYGRNGGQENRQGEVNGQQWEHTTEEKLGASLPELQEGAAHIRFILMEKKNIERYEKMIDVAFTKAEGGDFRYYQDLMDRRGGRPVAVQRGESLELTGDQVRDMAEQVREQFKQDGLKVLEGGKVEESA